MPLTLLFPNGGRCPLLLHLGVCDEAQTPRCPMGRPAWPSNVSVFPSYGSGRGEWGRSESRILALPTQSRIPLSPKQQGTACSCISTRASMRDSVESFSGRWWDTEEGSRHGPGEGTNPETYSFFLCLHPPLNSIRLTVVSRQPQCCAQATWNSPRLSLNICFRFSGKKNQGHWQFWGGIRTLRIYAHALLKWKRMKAGPKFSSSFTLPRFSAVDVLCFLSLCWLSTPLPFLL